MFSNRMSKKKNPYAAFITMGDRRTDGGFQFGFREVKGRKREMLEIGVYLGRDFGVKRLGR